MDLFLFEYLTSGACGRELPESLLVEGRSMLLALAEDCAAIPDCRVAIPWDVRLGRIPQRLESLPQVHAIPVDSPETERQVFDDRVKNARRCWIVAPESGGLLFERLRQVERLGGCAVGPGMREVELLSDKLATFRHLQSHGIPTIPTAIWRPGESLPFSFPVVVKPRDGAGSQETFLVSLPEQLAELAAAASTATERDNVIVQPFQPGRAISAAALVAPNQPPIVLPVAEQFLSDDGQFRYLGGRVRVPADRQECVEDVVLSAIRSLPGLSGYVGFDLLLNDDHNIEPVVVEVNPRLTTSYLGYRALSRDNLAALVIGCVPWRQPDFDCGSVRFLPDGTLSRMIQA